jgi:hypothetical protein
MTGYFVLLKKHGDKHYANLQHHDLPLGVRIHFYKPPMPGLLLDSGWYGPEEDLQWSSGEAVLRFWLPEHVKLQPIRLSSTSTIARSPPSTATAARRE